MPYSYNGNFSGLNLTAAERALHRGARSLHVAREQALQPVERPWRHAGRGRHHAHGAHKVHRSQPDEHILVQLWVLRHQHGQPTVAVVEPWQPASTRTERGAER